RAAPAAASTPQGGPRGPAVPKIDLTEDGLLHILEAKWHVRAVDAVGTANLRRLDFDQHLLMEKFRCACVTVVLDAALPIRRGGNDLAHFDHPAHLPIIRP